MKQMIVCGAGGYLGKYMCDFLSRAGYAVTGYDIKPENPLPGQLTYVQTDLTRREAFASLPEGADAIFFFTGLTGTGKSFTDYADYLRVNELSLLHLLDELKGRAHRPRIIFPSTRLVYDGVAATPLPEESVKTAKTVYAANKLACEAYLEAYSAVWGIDYKVLRICVPYGNLPQEKYSFGTIGFMLNQAESGEICLYGDGSARRTFTHAEDLCRQLLGLSSLNGCPGHVFNCDGEDYSLREVANLISARKNCTISFKPFPALDAKLESGDTVFCAERIRKALSFSCQYSLSKWFNLGITL